MVVVEESGVSDKLTGAVGSSGAATVEFSPEWNIDDPGILCETLSFSIHKCYNHLGEVEA